ncbi:hypothetical protein [Streptosporangium roseum]|uniref:hypothetical protein n=1 Tax=Streptosporangium roseum TaxID=2001 RepID=UPI003419E128
MDSVGASMTRFENLAAELGALRARATELEAELLTVGRQLRGAGVQQRLLGRLLGEHGEMKADSARKWLQRHGVEADTTPSAAPSGTASPGTVPGVEDRVAPAASAPEPLSSPTAGHPAGAEPVSGITEPASPAPAPAEESRQERTAPAGARPRRSPPEPATEPATEATLWERYGDLAKRRRWYTDAELTAVQIVTSGDLDGSSWVIVAGDLLGTVRPHLSARGTRSGWEARRRGGGAVYHLSGKGRGSHPATRDKAIAELVAEVHLQWTRQRRQARDA